MQLGITQSERQTDESKRLELKTNFPKDQIPTTNDY
jgi:hypothetical protein